MWFTAKYSLISQSCVTPVSSPPFCLYHNCLLPSLPLCPFATPTMRPASHSLSTIPYWVTTRLFLHSFHTPLVSFVRPGMHACLCNFFRVKFVLAWQTLVYVCIVWSCYIQLHALLLLRSVIYDWFFSPPPQRKKCACLVCFDNLSLLTYSMLNNANISTLCSHNTANMLPQQLLLSAAIVIC